MSLDNLDSILFYLFAVQILFSAFMTITRRNVVYSAVWLVNALHWWAWRACTCCRGLSSSPVCR